ncbi:MAG: UPF0149 family protein, partial [Xanthomonadales bacterium]|nr:UPF0149 family protein [Xanthomonadales bacterium]
MTLAQAEFDTMLNETGHHFDSARLSESHGVACGLLCRSPASQADDFMSLLASLHMLQQPELQVSQSLGRMFEVCRAQLDDDEFRFELYLPPDEDPLEERTTALAQWCTGFLAGLGSGQDGDVFDTSSEEVGEALSDLEQIARAELGGGDDSEEEESALVEIIEYLRVVTFMLREELRPASPHDKL